MKTFKLGGYMVFHSAVILLGITLVMASLFPAHAQQGAAVQDLARRVDTLEALNLDHRLTVIETILNDLHSDHWTHLGTMLGTGLLIIERAARAVKKSTEDE